jgi:hypothetical protein
MGPLPNLVVLFTIFTTLASAFLPGPLFLGITPWDTISHAKQTELEIHTFLKNHFSLDFGILDLSVPTTIKNARNTIIAANEGVDSPKGSEKNYGPAHFDDEYFQAGQDHLMILRSQMIQYLQTGDVQNARTWLGRQLHTLQDFYAHSNWVEINPARTDISPVIGKPGQTVYSPATANTCTQYCLDTTMKDSFVQADYSGELQCFRGCFKGDQTTLQLARGRICAIGCLCANYYCDSNVINKVEVTTGYYLVPENPQSVKPAGKCSHGGLNDNGTYGIEGINKDSTMEYYAPHHFLHQQAAALGQKATQQYLQDLTQDWGTVIIDGAPYPQQALTDRQLRLLFGVGSSTLAFVIDTTGSMGDIISSVQDTAVAIVNKLRGTEFEPTSYVLMGYNDPVGSDLIATTDADAFIAQLESLFANGGGDCPEPAIAAVNAILDKVDNFADIFVFTDAQAKDPENLAGTIAKAKTIQARITVFQFPSECSLNSAYESLTQASSGTYFGLSTRSATSDLVNIAVDQIAPKIVPIYNDFPFSSTPTSLARRAASVTEILVDGTLDSITFTGEGPATLTITKPDGTIVGASDPSVTYLTLTDLTYVTITNPAPGTWKVSRSDTAKTGLSILGSSFLSFNYFQFVELGGSHPGWFPIDLSDLVPGQTYTAKADLEGNYSSASFQFRAQGTGAIMQSFDLTLLVGPSDLPPEHIWYGNITMPPCGAFYAYVIGKDATGAPFQRYYPSVFGTPGNCSTSPANTTSSAAPSLSTPSGKWNATTPTSTAQTSTTYSSQIIPISPANTIKNTTLSSSTPSGKWNTTTPTLTAHTCTACDGQGVPMTETVV